MCGSGACVIAEIEAFFGGDHYSTMGFQDYHVLLGPKTEASQIDSPEMLNVQDIADFVMSQWPSVFPDVQEEGVLGKRIPLVYRTEFEIFQMLIYLRENPLASWFSLRFAYINPRTVYDPFCQMVKWLIHNFNYECYVMRELSLSDDLGIDNTGNEVIRKVEDVDQTLILSMDYNREKWRKYAGDVEAPLRPTEVLRWFEERQSANSKGI